MSPSHAVHRRRGRPAGLTKNRMFKRYVIAEAIIQGTKIAAVARQLGVSRSWASREANSEGTRLIIAEALESRHERFIELFDRALDVFEEAFAATTRRAIAGQIWEEPDHYARLEAVKIFLRFAAKMELL